MIQGKRGVLTGLKKEPRGRSTYDSLFEKKYMHTLEEWGGVKEWTKDHGIVIPYRMFGIILKKYHPDFLVTFANGEQEVHETKGAGFLAWASTHAKRRAADAWCKERGMKYQFIENSRGAMFVQNQGLEKMERRGKNFDSLDDMLG